MSLRFVEFLLVGLLTIFTSICQAAVGFKEDFSNTILARQWQVWQWQGKPWTYYIPHRYSLTDNPGSLRFYLGAMTEQGPEPFFQAYWGYPSIHLRRKFAGSHWTFEAKVSYYLPFSNNRHFYMEIKYGNYFQPVGIIKLRRSKDVSPGEHDHLFQACYAEESKEAYISHPDDPWSNDFFTYYYRVMRKGYDFIVQWSIDGVSYATALEFTMGTLIDGLDQWISITGASWFTPTGSYADYDYIYLMLGEPSNQRANHSSSNETTMPVRRVSELEHLRFLVQETEAVVPQLVADEYKACFLASRTWVYEKIIDMLFSLHQQHPSRGYEKEAFYYAERAKARALLQLLVEAKTKVRKGIAPDLLAKEQKILDSLDRAHEEQFKSELSAEAKKAIELVIYDQTCELSKVRWEMQQQNPKFAQLLSPQSYSAQKVQTDFLDEKTVLLEYFLGEQRSLLWVMTNNSVTMHALPRQVDIERHVQFYLDLISHDASIDKFTAAARHLYDELLAPAQDKLATCSHLLIVPDGMLNYLPFGALIDKDKGGSFILERYSLANSPSATAWGLIREGKTDATNEWRFELIAFGDPRLENNELTERCDFTPTRLKYAAEEVTKIGNLYARQKRKFFLGKEATEEKVKQGELAGARRIHFATHGLLNETVAGRSCLILAREKDSPEDGFLEMNEIFGLELIADLVVLSACQTGRGTLFQGEGLRGLTRAFLYAGTPSVIVSLWKVNDRSTALLMEKFYAHLEQGTTKGDALRLAQLDLMRIPKERYRHPYYWAPFVLIGDDR